MTSERKRYKNVSNTHKPKTEKDSAEQATTYLKQMKNHIKTRGY